LLQSVDVGERALSITTGSLRASGEVNESTRVFKESVENVGASEMGRNIHRVPRPPGNQTIRLAELARP
jgi:hypothetical protein